MAKFNVEEFLNGCPEWLRPDARVLVMLGLTPEELREEVKKLILAHNAPAKGAVATQSGVDSDFIKAVKAIRLKHAMDTQAAKVNGEKPPASAKIPSLAHGEFTVGAKAGWLCTSLGFNGTLDQAKKLMAILPEAVAYYDANAQYAELTRFVASVK